MSRRSPRLSCGVFSLVVALSFPAAWGQERVADTVHNLSVSGPGEIRAAEERQVCVFCHAPHHTSGVRPLWNRELPVSAYRIYESSTLDAQPGQPTGASKLCLSCHDGTIALGSVLSRADRIRMVGGDFIPAGLSNLGTDLSDDHPVSFFYSSGLAAADRQLASPLSLPPEIKLDESGQLQCTACHDPHRNVHGNFLVKSNEFGQLCIACHNMDGWVGSSHQTSNRPAPSVPTLDWPYQTVAENACRSCHRPHTAGGRQRLFIFEEEEANCLDCHDGQTGGANILSELDKRSAHDPRRYLGIHDPIETLSGDQDHVECADCHNAHAVTEEPPVGRYVPIGATLARVRGVTIAGNSVEQAQYEYEVCFRCHADSAVQVSQSVRRQAQTTNLRLKFSPTSRSYHPVVSPSPNTDTVSLVPGLATGSRIRCTDCHNSDAAADDGASGPRGPHGSIYEFLLERNYTVSDDNTESEYEYALCYKCHQRSSILSDQSFPQHRRHIVDSRTPCSACHDPHGISAITTLGSDHTHLINFDTTIVRPNPTTLRLEFRDLGRFAGSCTLTCHGAVHTDLTYGIMTEAVP
jgi:predicted CXXCH cytochrome family protein